MGIALLPESHHQSGNRRHEANHDYYEKHDQKRGDKIAIILAKSITSVTSTILNAVAPLIYLKIKMSKTADYMIHVIFKNILAHLFNATALHLTSWSSNFRFLRRLYLMNRAHLLCTFNLSWILIRSSSQSLFFQLSRLSANQRVQRIGIYSIRFVTASNQRGLLSSSETGSAPSWSSCIWYTSSNHDMQKRRSCVYFLIFMTLLGYMSRWHAPRKSQGK